MSNVTFNTKACFERVTPTLFVSSFGLLCPIIYSSCYPDCGVDGQGEAQKHSEWTGKRKKEEREKEGGRGSSSLFVSFPNRRTVLGLSCYR